MFRFPSTYFSQPEPSPLDFGYSRPSSRQYSYQDFDSFRRSQEIERLIREQQVRYQREHEELKRQRELEAEEEMKRLWISEMRRREQEDAKRKWIAEMQRREFEAATEAKRRYIEQEERRKRARFEDEALRLLAQEKRRVEREEEAEARRNEREEGVEGIFRLLGFGPSFDAPTPAAPRQSKPAPPSKKTKPQPAAVFVEKHAEKAPAQASEVPSPPHSPIPDLIPTATSVRLAKIASKLTTLASTVLPSPSTLHLTSPILGFHQSNIAYLTQKEQLEKLLLELDGIDSEGKEEVRKERKRLVLRAEEALQELEGKVKAEWEQRNRDYNDEQVPAPADVEAPVTEEKMEVDSLAVEAEGTATEEKVEVEVNSKAVEKELEDNVAIAPTLEVQTESTQNKTVVVPIEFIEETSSVLDTSRRRMKKSSLPL
ncbi:hypothetical protein BT69DRAFT_781354 [Atractiella rhizophila]|nr:hypothetical protein BT69DRAFT_781354 [Atractiella rhizophila]